jgi:hypothetical protein
MRQVVLYKVEQSEVMAASDYIEYHEMVRQSPSYLTKPTVIESEPSMVMDAITYRVPVHRISSSKMNEKTGEVDRRDQYIALDHRLKEILELPIRTEYRTREDNMLAKIHNMKSEIGFFQAEHCRIMTLIDNMTFWQRLKWAFTKRGISC